LIQTTSKNLSKFVSVEALASSCSDTNRGRPMSFFWADTDVFQFSMPISDANTDIFVILKQYLFCLMRQN